MPSHADREEDHDNGKIETRGPRHSRDLERSPGRRGSRLRDLVPRRASARAVVRPGFRASWRYRAIEGEPEYFSFYETDTPEVLFSKTYETRVDSPTPLTQRIMSGIFQNATRALLTRTVGWGALHGAFAVSVRFDEEPPSGWQSQLQEVAAVDYVVRAECWVPTRANAPAALSAEQKLRGPDKTVSAAGVVETAYEPEARAVAATLRNVFGSTARIGVYRLFCSLHSADL